MSGRAAVRNPARHAFGLTRAARRFFATVLGVSLLAALTEAAVSRAPGLAPRAPEIFPPAFWISSGLLLGGSILISRALGYVRREKQGPFRWTLVTTLVVGALFVGVQSFGLWTLMPHDRTPQAAQAGVNAFVLMLAALHALHFVVAVLFLSFVTVRAFDDRYDHEYHWGVTVCAWFWHALGVVWIGILAVFAIVAA
ncbi:MAG: cytochrome c oxidase subunit 3 [Planctomycetaceae bacterium]|nr:cytochrome c oxidase subunit 3 [Planctomycetaceae bacterium]